MREGSKNEFFQSVIGRGGMRMDMYLLIHPAVEQSSLHSPSSSLTGGEAASHDIIIRKDGSVLCHNVKQVDPAHFNRLTDVVVGCRKEEMKE